MVGGRQAFLRPRAQLLQRVLHLGVGDLGRAARGLELVLELLRQVDVPLFFRARSGLHLGRRRGVLLFLRGLGERLVLRARLGRRRCI